jgi:hypothetical protein
MSSRYFSLLLAGLALLAGLDARAASVSLVPSSATVVAGSTFTVSLALDVTGVVGNHPGDYTGRLVVDYDPLKLAYQSFSFSSPATQTHAPATGSSGGRSTVSLGFLTSNAPDVGAVGVFTFKALNSLGQTSLNVADYDDFLGTFYAKDPTDQRFVPEFVDTSMTVSAVPLPATAWLLVTAFGLVGVRHRFARKARHAHS